MKTAIGFRFRSGSPTAGSASGHAMREVDQLKAAVVRVSRHMPNTANDRFIVMREQTERMEALLRVQLEREEAIVRGQFACVGARTHRAAASAGRVRPGNLKELRVHAAGMQLPPLLSLDTNRTPVELLLGFDRQPQEDVMTMESEAASAANVIRPSTAGEVWAMRRGAARERAGKVQKRHQPSSTDAELRSAASPRDGDAPSPSRSPSTATAVTAVAASTAVAAVSHDDAVLLTLERRCREMERDGLVFKYRAEWISTLQQQAGVLEQVSRDAVNERKGISAVHIQKSFRMHRCRSAYHMVLHQLLQLQRCGRAYCLRRGVPSWRRETIAGRLILRCWSGYRERWLLALSNLPQVLLKRQNAAATRIQTCFRASRARRWYWLKRRQHRAVRIMQRVVRGFLEHCHIRNKETAMLHSVATMEWSQRRLDVRLMEGVMRSKLELREHAVRRQWMNIAIGLGTAIIRRTVAKRRIAQPTAQAATVGAGLLAPSCISRSDDYCTPRFESIFTERRMQLAAIPQRPASHAVRERQMREAAIVPTSSSKGRMRLRLLEVEAEENVARWKLQLEALVFTEFMADHVLWGLEYATSV